MLFIDGVEQNRPYEVSNPIMNIRGKLAFIALQDDDYFLVFGDQEGKRYPMLDTSSAPTEESDSEPKAFYIPKLYDIGGTPTFVVRTVEGREFVVHGLDEHKVYDHIDRGSIQYYQGKLTYFAFEREVPPEKPYIPRSRSKLADGWFTVSDGKEGRRYRDVSPYSGESGPPSDIVDIGGRLAYVAYDTEIEEGFTKKGFIVYGESELGRQYLRAERPMNVGGKLAYYAYYDIDKRFIVMEK